MTQCSGIITGLVKPPPEAEGGITVRNRLARTDFNEKPDFGDDVLIMLPLLPAAPSVLLRLTCLLLSCYQHFDVPPAPPLLPQPLLRYPRPPAHKYDCADQSVRLSRPPAKSSRLHSMHNTCRTRQRFAIKLLILRAALISLLLSVLLGC